jgi:hypothetical protein
VQALNKAYFTTVISYDCKLFFNVSLNPLLKAKGAMAERAAMAVVAATNLHISPIYQQSNKKGTNHDYDLIQERNKKVKNFKFSFFLS